MEKTLTISVAAYNADQFLRQALESLAACGCADALDVIVVNDGSTDGTSGIAHEYARRFPDVFRVVDKQNGGYGSTINASLPLARGTYFRLLDADDWVDSAELDKLVGFLAGSDADTVVAKCALVDDASGKYTLMEYPAVHDGETRGIDAVDLPRPLQMHMVAFRTARLRESGMRITEQCPYTDFEFVVRGVAASSTLAFFDANVYQYRVGRDGQSVSIRSWQKNLDKGIGLTVGMMRQYAAWRDEGALSAGQRRYIEADLLESMANKFKIFLSFKPSRDVLSRMLDYDELLHDVDVELYGKSLTFGPYAIQLLRKSSFRLYGPIAAACWIHFK